MKTCHYCGTDYAFAMSQCPSCSAREAEMRCATCGNHSTTEFCLTCQSATKASAEPMRSQTEETALSKFAGSVACGLGGHNWNGCKCVRCGTERNERHDWNGCKCAICGGGRDGHHKLEFVIDKHEKVSWEPHCKQICTICDTKITKSHDYDGGDECINCTRLKRQNKKPVQVFAAVWLGLIAVAGIGAISESAASDKPAVVVVQEVKVPESATSFKDQNFERVVGKLEQAGFTNVSAEPMGDLITGWITKPDTVDEVVIGFDATFAKGTKYAPDTAIVVRYHSFPEKKDTPVASGTEEIAPLGDDSEVDDGLNLPYGNESEQRIADEETRQEALIALPDILNIENNADLAALLAETNPNGSTVVDFAAKYRGKTIEFDAYIFESFSRDGYTRIYDAFPIPGDKPAGDLTEAYGPNFAMHRVNLTQFPAIVEGCGNTCEPMEGPNVHIIAKVGTYDAKTSLFELDPISIESR